MAITPEILVITGPTASGKSGLAFSIAQKRAEQNRNSVIINADSQQVYQELRVITARPTEAEEQAAAHKLYGFVSVTEPFSAGKWLKYARMEIDWALSQSVLPIVVGGTGLYIKSLISGIADIPEIPHEVRLQANNDYDQMGKDAFSERLRHVDPAFFERLKVYDRQRLVRAYEVWLGSGKSLSWWQAQEAKPAYSSDYFKHYQMDIPRELLYKRCDERFVQMLDHGALNEIKHLLSMNIPIDNPAMKSVGIKELGAYLRQEITLEAAIQAAQQATRNYAKRQLTWFRHQCPPNHRIDIDNAAEIARILTHC